MEDRELRATFIAFVAVCALGLVVVAVRITPLLAGSQSAALSQPETAPAAPRPALVPAPPDTGHTSAKARTPSHVTRAVASPESDADQDAARNDDPPGNDTIARITATDSKGVSEETRGVAIHPVADVHWAADADVRAAETRLRRADEALADDPEHPAALHDRAAALKLLDRWEQAAATLKRLTRVRPDDVLVRLDYGTTLARLARWVEAITEFEHVTEAAPGEPRAWHNLAIAHQALGHLRDARRAWDRVIDLSPENAEARARRGEVSLDFKQWSEAIVDFQIALEAQPRDAETALNLALAYWKLGRAADARRTVLSVLEHRPRHVPAINRMAELAWAMYRSAPDRNEAKREAAMEWCRRSLAIDPAQPIIAALLEAAETGQP